MSLLRYALLAAFCASAFPQSFVVRDVVVVDGTGAQPYHGTVVVEDGRIAAAGPDVAAPPGAKAIDGRGKTLLPGLFDLHTHLAYSGASGLAGDWAKNLKAYLYSGVTSVVDFGAYPEQFAPMRRLLAERVVAGPRIHMAARIAPPYGHGLEGGRGDYFSYTAYSPEDGRAAVRELLAYEPDAIKIFSDGWRYGYAEPMADMAPETVAAIVEEAHRHGLEVLTHTVTLAGAMEAAAAGVDVIAHGTSDAAVDQRLIELLIENGTTYAPTLAVYHPRGRDILDGVLEAVVEPAARALVRPPLRAPDARSQLVSLYDDPASPRALRWKYLMANNRALRAAGVAFGAGTDAGVSNTWHGWSTLRELQLLVHGGLTPIEAIAAATGAAARALNVDSERGTIAAGKLADLLLIDGAPHERISDIQQIDRVFLGGHEVDRERLASEIRMTEPTPLPARVLPELLENFELDGRRSQIATNWVDTTDSGLGSSEIRFERTWRAPGDRALTVLARMAHEPSPYASVDLPLTPGGVEPADLSDYRGVRFEARGEGGYVLMITTRGVRNYDYHRADFTAAAAWAKVEIPFTSLNQRRATPKIAFTGVDATELMFRIERPAGASAWLELDNIELYR